MVHHNRFLILSLVCLLQFFAAGTIHGQEPAPGDACPVDQRYTRVGGPETSGVSHLMVCESGTWNAILSTDATGKITGIGNQTCTSGQVLEFDGTSWVCAASVVVNPGSCVDGAQIVWSAADGDIACEDRTPVAFSFTDQTGVATSTLTTSDIVQISGMDDGTGVSITGTGSPEYRICADGSCSTVNHTWTTASGSIDAGEYLQLRLTSNGSNSTTNSATVTVGTVSDQWDVTTGAGGPTGCPSIGDQCSDNSYYIGDIGAGKVYATTATHESTQSWNDGTTNYSTTGLTSTTDGEGNTATLIGLTGASDYPFQAAEYCNGLSAHGHSDWYLPAQDELNLFYNGGAPVAGIGASGTWYWSSTENTSDNAWGQRFNTGQQSHTSKYDNSGRYVRCVRR